MSLQREDWLQQREESKRPNLKEPPKIAIRGGFAVNVFPRTCASCDTEI